MIPIFKFCEEPLSFSKKNIDHRCTQNLWTLPRLILKRLTSDVPENEAAAASNWSSISWASYSSPFMSSSSSSSTSSSYSFFCWQKIHSLKTGVGYGTVLDMRLSTTLPRTGDGKTTVPFSSVAFKMAKKFSFICFFSFVYIISYLHKL